MKKTTCGNRYGYELMALQVVNDRAGNISHNLGNPNIF